MENYSNLSSKVPKLVNSKNFKISENLNLNLNLSKLKPKKLNLNWILLFLFLIFSIFFLFNCKKGTI
jgi:hypothetical protein